MASVAGIPAVCFCHGIQVWANNKQQDSLIRLLLIMQSVKKHADDEHPAQEPQTCSRSPSGRKYQNPSNFRSLALIFRSRRSINRIQRSINRWVSLFFGRNRPNFQSERLNFRCRRWTNRSRGVNFRSWRSINRARGEKFQRMTWKILSWPAMFCSGAVFRWVGLQSDDGKTPQIRLEHKISEAPVKKRTV